MTIRPGEEWGEPVERPDGLETVGGDAELASVAVADPARAYAVSGGDLHRSLGSPPPRSRMQRVTLDLIEIVADRRDLVAAAHVIARRSWWRGPIVAVMNVDHLGEWKVAPRAHPNDGRLDIVEVASSMGIRQRALARRRLRAGEHVPHPDIGVRTADAATWTFGRAMRLTVDGVGRGTVRELSVRVRPDAYRLHV